MIDGNQLREEFGRYLAEHKATRWGMDAALMHVCKIAYDAGKADGPGAALHSREYEIEVPAEPGIHPLKFTGLPLQNWRDEQLHALCNEMGNALKIGEITTPDLLDWVADRFIHVYGENPNMDFIHCLRSRAAAGKSALAKWKESK